MTAAATCAYCGGSMPPSGGTTPRIYCSRLCRYTAYNERQRSDSLGPDPITPTETRHQRRQRVLRESE